MIQYELEIKQLHDYEIYLKNEERSKATIQKYIRDIKQFYQFLKGDLTVTKEKVMEFKAYLGENYKTNSANSMLASVNGFLMWGGLGGLRVKCFKTQRQIFSDRSRELTLKEYEGLVKAAREMGKERLEMVLQTIGGTGIRISELSTITVEAVRQGQVSVTGKGKQRIVFLTPKLRKYLLKYCKQHKIHQGVVFITKGGKPVDRSNIWKEMKKICREARVDPTKVFPHNLRHLFARTCYKKKKDIVYLADILGHSNIETTRIYTISSGSEHKKMLSSLGLVI